MYTPRIKNIYIYIKEKRDKRASFEGEYNKTQKEVLPRMLQPIPQKLRIHHALLPTKYGSIMLSSRRAMRDNRYCFKITRRIQVLDEYVGRYSSVCTHLVRL
jgi:hypothetical protein